MDVISEERKAAVEAYEAILALKPDVDRLMGDDSPERMLEEFAVIVERYVFCLECGSRHPSEDNFCSVCGHALRPISSRRGKFEHREITVQLDLAADSHREDVQIVDRYDQVMHDALAGAAHEGWIPVGSTSLASLERQGRVKMRERGGFTGPAFVYETVKVRMRRPRVHTRESVQSVQASMESGAHREEVAGLVPA